MHAPDLISKFINRQKNTNSILYNLADVLGEAEKENKYSVEFIEHHLAHLCSSYFVSDFDSATGFSYDGSGDFSSALHAVCEGTTVTIKDRVKLPHSLGHFYTALCQFIGFDRFGVEISTKVFISSWKVSFP